MTVRISEFARETLSSGGGQSNAGVSSQAGRAIRCYLNDKGQAGQGWSYPSFLEGQRRGREVEMQLSIDSALWAALEKEADRQGVGAQQLLEHAVLYFAAEVNAGRVTERILGDFDDA